MTRRLGVTVPVEEKQRETEKGHVIVCHKQIKWELESKMKH